MFTWLSTVSGRQGRVTPPVQPKEGSVQVKTSRRLAWLALPLSLALVAGACGSDDDDDETGSESGGEESGGEEQDFSGESVNISGSSTVAPITEIVAEEFDGTTGSSTTVDDPGTGDGFELFCGGEIDISNASRPIDEEEVAACEAGGIEYVELQVAYDGMAVMTSPDNEAVECLSFPDLYALIGPESNGFDNWSDGQAIATELGSSTELPDEPLDLTGPGTESGTYDSFIELALAPIAETRPGLPEDQWETTRTDYESSSDDNIIISNVEGSDTSLGWVGWAYAKEQGDAVRNIAIAAEADGDCVEVSDETIADESYPLARSLYIYVNTTKAEENPAVAGFVDFYLEGLDDWVSEAGYVTLPEDQKSATSEAWDGR